MTDLIFARPRHDYASYRDVYRVIELSGFPLRFVDEIDWAQDVTVIGTPKHPEWAAIPTHKRARLIWWNLERMHIDEPLMDMSNPFIPPCVDEVWAADRAIAKQQGAKYVFFGGHRAFGSVDVCHKEYDIVTLMAPMARRAKLFEELRQFKSADNGSLWGEERDQRLRHTRLMLMAHQDDYRWVWPPRMMLGGCYALPMLCEECDDPGYWGGACEFAPLHELATKARYLLQDDVRLARMSAAAWRLACVERPLRKEVEAAL